MLVTVTSLWIGFGLAAPCRAAQARGAGVNVAGDDTWSDIFSKLLVGFVEPNLGLGRPTALVDYPACEAALASKLNRAT